MGIYSKFLTPPRLVWAFFWLEIIIQCGYGLLRLSLGNQWVSRAYLENIGYWRFLFHSMTALEMLKQFLLLGTIVLLLLMRFSKRNNEAANRGSQ